MKKLHKLKGKPLFTSMTIFTFFPPHSLYSTYVAAKGVIFFFLQRQTPFFSTLSERKMLIRCQRRDKKKLWKEEKGAS